MTIRTHLIVLPIAAGIWGIAYLNADRISIWIDNRMERQKDNIMRRRNFLAWEAERVQRRFEERSWFTGARPYDWWKTNANMATYLNEKNFGLQRNSYKEYAQYIHRELKPNQTNTTTNGKSSPQEGTTK